MARTSSGRSVVRDKPGRADILLGNSLLCETQQKNEQEELYCFHAALTLIHRAISYELKTNLKQLHVENETAVDVYVTFYLVSFHNKYLPPYVYVNDTKLFEVNLWDSFLWTSRLM